MKFSREQIQELSKFEEYFYSAVNADWCRYPGKVALQTIHRIFCAATGDTRRYNDNCSHCVLTLVKDCGVQYYRDKAEMALVGQSSQAAEVKAKVAVKTRKKVQK